MDTRQMKYVLAIAECGSISKAAEQMFISQSGLNQQLKRIENDLGISLFDRDTHKLTVTEAGAIFLRYARSSLNQEKQMRAMLSDAVDGNIGELRVNLAMEQGIELFCTVFPEFHAKYPQVELKLEDHIVYDQYKLLEEGKLDLGMVMVKNHEMDNLEYVHLATERLLLGVPAGHPLTQFYVPTEDGDYPEMDLSLCRQEAFSLMFAGSTFRQVVDPCFERAGFSPKIMFEARANHVIAMIVASGICLTILPESQVKLYPNLCWFRLNDDPTWENCIIYPKEQPPRKAGRYFIELAVKHAKSLTARSKPNWRILG